MVKSPSTDKVLPLILLVVTVFCHRRFCYVGCYAPIGCLKSPEDSHKLIPDAETAPIIRRMYELAVQGKGYKAIGNVLKRERIPIPAPPLFYWKEVVVMIEINFFNRGLTAFFR